MGYFESFIGVNFWTALATLLNFLILFFVGKHFLIGPVLKIISDRQQEIDDLYTGAAQAEANAQALEKAHRQKLSAAAQTGERIVKDAVARGQAQEEAILRSAHAEAAAILDKAASNIALEKKKAFNEAKEEISVIAIAIAKKVVARALKPEDQENLVDAFIDRLGDA